MRNTTNILIQVIFTMALSLIFFSGLVYADTVKFVYIYDSNGSLLEPLNPASSCPDPAGGTEPATECLGIEVDSKGEYKARLSSSDLDENNLVFIVNEYQVIPAGSKGKVQDTFVIMDFKRRIEKIEKDKTNEGVDINSIAEATVKAVEKLHKTPKAKKGKISKELAQTVADKVDADKLNHSMNNGKADNKKSSDKQKKHERDIISTNQDKLDESEEQILVDLATLVLNSTDDQTTQDYVRSNVTQALLLPELLDEISNAVFSHISDIQNVTAGSGVVLLEADKYFVYIDEPAQLTTANSVNPNNFFAYTWQGVDSELSSATFSKPTVNSYLVCVTGEIDSGNDSSTDCIRLAVKEVVDALARAGSKRLGTGNTMVLNASLSVGASSFSWSGSGAFQDSSAVETVWTAPETPGTYEITLSINNGEDTDSVRVEVFDVLPVAIAEADAEYVYLTEGLATINFVSGSIATDGSAVDSLSWSITSQPSASQANLTPATAQTTQLVASIPGNYTITLVAAKGADIDSTDIIVQVRQPDAPIADAGSDQITFRNQPINLNGSRSYVPLGKSINYNWSALSGTVASPTNVITTYNPTEIGDIKISLDVSDGNLSATDSINVSVRNQLPQAKDDLIMHDMKEIYYGQLPAYDNDNDTLNYIQVSETSSGSVTVDLDTGSYVYMPGGTKGCTFKPYAKPSDNGSGGRDVPVIKLCADKSSVGPGEIVTLSTSNSINASKFSGYSWNVDVTAVDLTTYKFTSNEPGTHHICITGNIGQSRNTSTACVDLTVSGNQDWGVCGIDHSEPGLIGGHFDVDTSNFIASIGDGGTSKHTHEYDDKFNESGIDAFNMQDKHKGITDAIDPNQKFKIIIANADLSSGARVSINRDHFGPNTSTYQVASDYDDTDPGILPIYSLSGLNGATKLDKLSLNFDTLAIINRTLHPTNTGDVRKNVAGKQGEWRNGALVLQIVAVNDDGSDAFSTDASKSNGGVQGVATDGLLWELAVFWHWNGPSYHQAGWASYDPSSDLTSLAAASGSTFASTDDCTAITSGFADSFQYKANDGYDNSRTGTIWFNVGWVNSIAEISDAAISTNEETAVSGQLEFTDIDEQTHNFRVFNNGALGTAVFTDPLTGAFTYTPKQDATGIDTFTFIVNDGYEDSLAGTVTITINDLNDVPVAYYAGDLQTPEEVPVDGILGAIDPDNDVLDFRLVTIPNKGDVVITNAQTGTFTYTPHKDKNGSDSFFFVVHDGTIQSNTAEVNIIIGPVNDEPIATDVGPLTTHTDETVVDNLSASDIDKDALIYQIVAQASKGSVELDSVTGEFTFTPNGTLGPDSFTFVAKDAHLTSNTATVSINVLESNTAPIAYDQINDKSITVFERVAYGGKLTGSDVDADPITFAIANNGVLGSAQVSSATTGDFVYTANAYASGQDLFTFQVSDGDKVSTPGNVAVNIISNDTLCNGPGNQSRDTDGDGYADFIETLFSKNINDASSNPSGLNLNDIPYSFENDNDSDGYADIVEVWLKTDHLDAASMPSDSTMKNIPDCLTALWDTIPPALMGFSILTPTLDASTGTAVARFALTAVDNAVGVAEIDILLRSPSGVTVEGHASNANSNIVLYTEFDSEVFSQWAEAGEWEVAELRIRDQLGAELLLTTADLVNLNYPSTLIVDNVNSDIAAPTMGLGSFEILTPTLDISTETAFASFRFTVADDVSGIERMSVTLRSPSGKQIRWGEVIKTGNLLTLVQTVNTNIFSSYMESGTWNVSELVVKDHAGNNLQLNTSELLALGHPTTVEITNSNVDSIAPTLDNLVVLTPIVDLASENKSAGVSVSATDDKSGLKEIDIELTSPSGTVIHVGNYASLDTPLVIADQRIDLNPFTWYSERGFWTISKLSISDAAGNSASWTTQQLQSLGYTLDSLQVEVRCTCGGGGLHVLYAYTSSYQTQEDTDVSGKLTGYDNISGHDLTYSIVSNGSLGTVSFTDASTGAFTYTPHPNVYGIDSFAYKVDDGTYDSNIVNITVTIEPVADDTLVEDMAIVVTENQTYSDLFPATDVDGEELTYTIVTNGSLGTAQFPNVKRNPFQYIPNPNTIGNDSFTVRVNDSNSSSVLATVSVTIVPDMSLVGFDVLTPEVSGLGEYARISCNISLSKATDEAFVTLVGPSGQVLGFHAATKDKTYPVLMTNYIYTPSQPLEAGIWTFKNLIVKRAGAEFSEFVLADLVAAGFAATVTVIDNTPPVASISESFDVTIDGTKEGVLVATDAENDSLSYRIISGGSKGTVTILDEKTGAFRYVPSELGLDSFVFRANDGHADSNDGVVNINIIATNNDPVAHAQTVNVYENLAYIGKLTASDADNDTAEISFSIVTSPLKGEVTLDKNTGEFVYRPKPDSLYTEIFSFKASDGITDSNVAEITVIVGPSIDPSDLSITVLQNKAYNGALPSVSNNGGSLSYNLLSNASLGVVSVDSSTGEFAYTPNANALGYDQFSFNLTKDGYTTKDATVFVHIISMEQACGTGGLILSMDSDGDGYIDAIENAFGTSTSDALDTPATMSATDLGISYSDDDDADGHNDYIEQWLRSDFNDVESVPNLVVAECFNPISDGIKPRLIGFSIATPEVDVAYGDAVVSYHLSLLDNASGIKRVRVSLLSPTGVFVTASRSFSEYPLLTAIKLDTEAFSEFAEQGSWEISSITLFDQAGNRLNLNTTDLTAAQLPTTVQVINSNEDLTAPTLESLTIVSDYVYPGTADDKMIVDLVVADDASGISSARVDFISASGILVSASATLAVNTTDSTLIQLNTGVLSQYLEDGVWTVFSVLLVDAAGNSAQVVEQLANLGSVTTLLVTNPLSDALKPSLDAFSVITNEVYPADGDARMSFSVTASDNKSGIEKIRLDITGPSGQVMTAWGNYSTSFPLNTTAEVNTTVLSSLLEAGTWSISGVEIYDYAGNSILVDKDTLIDQGYPVTVVVLY